MDLRKTVRGSALYRAVATLREWVADSAAVSLATNERVQQAVVGVVLLVSVVSVLRSSMNASVKFLSFVALFAVTAALVWSVADPLGRGRAVDDDVESDRSEE
ncbi:hypothetical protein [Haloglomus litoreum]|uniref:hypothetical protein n=1 Tax=Haloglomus litoreum TaxID=3034026 RepID=UPI0023E7DA2B|nr:hypothetical protein [Haloglomus sp. DT116]